MADNLEPRVSDLEQRADSADNRTDNLEIRVSKLEGQRARDRANLINKKHAGECVVRKGFTCRCVDLPLAAGALASRQDMSVPALA